MICSGMPEGRVEVKSAAARTSFEVGNAVTGVREEEVE